MRKLLVVVLLAGLISDAHGAEPDAARFYVAVGGNDAWSGTPPRATSGDTDGPFATVARAVEALRALKAQQGGTLRQSVEIVLGEGAYFLETPITLTPADSGTADCPVVFRAADGTKPVVSGGRPVTGWRRDGDDLWTAELPAVKSGDWYFRTLRVADRWATRARYPNFDPGRPRTGGWLFAEQYVPDQKNGAFGVSVSNIHNVNDLLEWEIDVPAEGDYAVWLWYGHKMLQYNKPNMDDHSVLGVRNGAEAPLRNLPDTGGWNAVRWAHAADLPLTEGKQTLYWQNKKGGGINIDAICLCNDPDWTPKDSIHIQNDGSHRLDPPAEGCHALVIQSETCSKAVGPEIKVGVVQPKRISDRIIVPQSDFPAWKDWHGAEIHIFPAWGWVNTIVALKEPVPEKHMLRVDCPQDIRPGNRFCIANVREALDAPGEWCLDSRTGVLTYWPDSDDFQGERVVAPVHDTLFALQGEGDAFVEHIEFRGLTFMDSTYTLNATYSPQEAAIVMSGARGCRVEGCTFTLLGGYAARLEQKSNTNVFVRNAVTNVGQGGVIMVGDNTNQAFDNLVVANTMTDLGMVYKHVAGVYVTTGGQNRIVHNRIHRVPRYAISLKSYSPEAGSHGNLIEYNEIVDTNLETNDTGAIETLGRDREDTGNIIRFNLLRNSVGMKTAPDGTIMTPHFTWGVYMDDYSSGTTVYGNIVDGNVIGGFCIHGGRNNRVENNMFLNASEQQLRLQPRDDFMKGNTFTHNIVAYREPESVLWYSYAGTWRPDRLSECDYNVYWCYGGLDIAASDKAITPEGPYSKWLKTGHDAHSVVADPGFVSDEPGDYRLRDDSPVYKLGFKPIPMDAIGPEAYDPKAYE